MSKVTAPCGFSVYDPSIAKTRRFPATPNGWRLAVKHARDAGRKNKYPYPEIALVCPGMKAPTILGMCDVDGCDIRTVPRGRILY